MFKMKFNRTIYDEICNEANVKNNILNVNTSYILKYDKTGDTVNLTTIENVSSSLNNIDELEMKIVYYNDIKIDKVLKYSNLISDNYALSYNTISKIDIDEFISIDEEIEENKIKRNIMSIVNYIKLNSFKKDFEIELANTLLNIEELMHIRFESENTYIVI